MLKSKTTSKSKAAPNVCRKQRQAIARMKWCSRVLVTSPLYLGLCTSELSYRRELKRLGVENPSEWLEDTDVGKVHQFEEENGATAIIVCVRPSDSARSVQATVVHEAVHVWQFVKEYIGEREPSKEFEAYSVENIYTTLMDAYNEQHQPKTKRKQRTGAKTSAKGK